MVVRDPLLHTLFDGRYLISRKLGSGGMANVYLAEDQELGRRVAIKILDDRHASDDQFVERFRREAQNAAGLSHPSIVSIYDRGEAEGTYYIAMEYVEGRTLKELIVARGPSPIGIAIDYSRQILSALRFAHRSGIVHRDIKPHNVIVDSDGRVKVMDFGIARAGTSQMTEAGSIIGTAQYLSPEQARGAPVDQTSDLYSTGIVLYELLTGSVPFNGDTPVEIAMKHLSQTPAAPSTHRPEIPRDLDYVILRALAKDPSERYHSAEEMNSDLERIGRGIGVSAETAEAATTVLSRDRRPTPRRRSARAQTTTAYTPGRYYEYDETRRRRSIWPWLLAVLALGLAVVGGFFGYQQLQDQFSASEPVTVPDVEGIDRVARGRPDRGTTGCEANVRREPRLGHADRDRRRAGSGAAEPDRAGQLRHDRRLHREAEGAGARASSGDVATTPSWPCRDAGSDAAGGGDQLGEAGEHGHGAGAEGGHGARRGLDGADQRLDRAEAGRGSERDRGRLRVGRLAAAGDRLRGRPDERRVGRARRDRRRRRIRTPARRAPRARRSRSRSPKGRRPRRSRTSRASRRIRRAASSKARASGSASFRRTPRIRSRTGT